MKPCVYRGKLTDGMIVCTNHHDLIHDGILPAEICVYCPYASEVRKDRGDFFSQTSELLVRKAASGEYVANPKPCGGCGEVKRRETDVMQFVYPYWHRGASDDEIRWSVRSVERNFRGTARITIIGDRPPWYTGHYIPQQRVGKHNANRSFRDMLTKVWTMATHPEIDQEFVWMMDDVYLIKPVTIEELSIPRAVRWHECESNSWQRRKKNTMRALSAVGRTVHDYATHLPHVAEKEKLRILFDEFRLDQNTLLWEVLYGNTFRGPPQSPFPFFRRIQKKIGIDDLKQITELASVFNHTAVAWCQGVRQYLEDLFPEPARNEQANQPYEPRYLITHRTRPPVKRRAPETHRAFIERQGK